jgi:hypothetical protein
MQTDRTRGVAAPSALPVRLLRVADGQEKLLLALSREILGFIGHWDGETFQSCRSRVGRCRLCPGPTVWRGYFAALVWDRESRQWQPAGVEVSETVEATMREQYRPGTRWHLHKPWPVRGRKQRVYATLRGAHEATDLPAPFDFLPLVRALYQDADLALDVPNPKVSVSVAAFPQPAAPEDPKHAPAAAPDERLPSILEEANRRFGSASNGSNRGENKK